MLAVRYTIEVVTLYAVEAGAAVDVVPVSVVGVQSVAARAGVDVVAARAGENPVATGVVLQQVGAAAAVQRVVAGPTAQQRVGVPVPRRVSLPLPPFLVAAIAIPAVNASFAPATMNDKTTFLMRAPFSAFTVGLLPCDTFSGGSTLVNG